MLLVCMRCWPIRFYWEISASSDTWSRWGGFKHSSWYC